MIYKPQSSQCNEPEQKREVWRERVEVGSPGVGVLCFSLGVSISVVPPLASLRFVVSGF